jgi:hypothetical protein
MDRLESGDPEIPLGVCRHALGCVCDEDVSAGQWLICLPVDHMSFYRKLRGCAQRSEGEKY